MKYNKSITYSVIAAIATFMAVACNSSDNDFTAGPKSTNNGKSVYFTNDYDKVNVYGDKPVSTDTLWFKVKRNDKSSVWNVPLISSGDTAIHVPSSVTFAAGEDSTWVPVTCENIKFSVPSNFTITISDDYADVYGEKDGSTTLSSSVLWSEWKDVCDTVLIVSAYKLFPRQGCKLQNLYGLNRFRFTDFLGSGNPLEFSIKTNGTFCSSDLTQNAGSLVPLKRFYQESSCWDWSNDGDWTPFTPKGDSIEISYVSFYTSYNYDYIDLSMSKKTYITLNNKQYYYDLDAYYKNVEMVYLWRGVDSKWDYLYFMFCYEDKDNE